MTNPGYIDPGYEGPLHLTVINMSRTPFPLATGSRIARVLFILPLSNKPDAPYNARHPQGRSPRIRSELLEYLSADIVNVRERAQQIAEDAVKRAQFWAATVPVTVAVLALFGTVFATIWANSLSKTDLQKIGDRLTVVETEMDQRALEDRINKVEDALKRQPATQSR